MTSQRWAFFASNSMAIGTFYCHSLILSHSRQFILSLSLSPPSLTIFSLSCSLSASVSLSLVLCLSPSLTV